MEEVVIVAGARTAIGDFLGSLKAVPAVELGVIAVKGALAKAGVDASIVEDVVGGMVYKGGAKGNPARQVQLAVGIPVEAAATTVDQQCGSAMRALEIASQQIMLGKSSVSVVVGMENMSRVPYYVPRASGLSAPRSGAEQPGRVELRGYRYQACAFDEGVLPDPNLQL